MTTQSLKGQAAIVTGAGSGILNDFGEYLQRENQAFNNRVNTICPGMVVSEMTENTPGLDHAKLIQTIENPWE